jgi:hypothetical protein
MTNIASDLRKRSGATGIRTPDLLHAIQRQDIHHRPSTQVTVPGRPHQSPGIQAGCCTFLLYQSAQRACSRPPQTSRHATSQGLLKTLPAEPSREPGSGRDRQGPTIPSLPGRTTQFSLHSRQTAMTTPACSGSAVASAAPCIRSSGQRDINVRFCRFE